MNDRTMSASGAVDRELYQSLYRTMSRIRAAELMIQRYIAEHEFGGLWHPGLGHEATHAGSMRALRRDDYLTYSHRGLGLPLAKGMSLEAILGDLFGRITGSTAGKGAGTPHFADPSVGVLGQGGTLGSCFAISVGAAISARLKGEDTVSCAVFGDGAAARGTFHEALIPAATQKLAVVWICENNGWALSAEFRQHNPTDNIADRAAGYGIPGVVVDGYDAVAVCEATQDAVDRARAGNGPTLIEAKTARLRGHYEGDQQKYRHEDLAANDPLARIRDRIPIELALQFDSDSEAEAQMALGRTLLASKPDRSLIFKDIWA